MLKDIGNALTSLLARVPGFAAALTETVTGVIEAGARAVTSFGNGIAKQLERLEAFLDNALNS